MLLFFTHYSRYFLSLEKINNNKKKQIILTLIGIIYLVLNLSLLFIADCILVGNITYGFYLTLLVTCFIQTILNLVDFIIERQKLQKYLFILFGIIIVLFFSIQYFTR